MATDSCASATSGQEESESEDSTSTGSEGQTEGWTKMGWSIYFVKLKKEFMEGRAPMDLLLRGWEIYVHLPDQPGPRPQAAETGQARREWVTTPPWSTRSSWTKTDWITYIEALEKEVRERRAPQGLLLNACAQFVHFHSTSATELLQRFGQ